MSGPEPASDWLWPDAAGPADPGNEDVAQAFAACFSEPAGKRVLGVLKQRFLKQRIHPSRTDAEIWHAEGQRSVIAEILGQIERGVSRK